MNIGTVHKLSSGSISRAPVIPYPWLLKVRIGMQEKSEVLTQRPACYHPIFRIGERGVPGRFVRMQHHQCSDDARKQSQHAGISVHALTSAISCLTMVEKSGYSEQLWYFSTSVAVASFSIGGSCVAKSLPAITVPFG